MSNELRTLEVTFKLDTSWVLVALGLAAVSGKPWRYTPIGAGSVCCEDLKSGS